MLYNESILSTTGFIHFHALLVSAYLYDRVSVNVEAGGEAGP
jgi:hypothetical protein